MLNNDLDIREYPMKGIFKNNSYFI